MPAASGSLRRPCGKSCAAPIRDDCVGHPVQVKRGNVCAGGYGERTFLIALFVSIMLIFAGCANSDDDPSADKASISTPSPGSEVSPSIPTSEVLSSAPMREVSGDAWVRVVDTGGVLGGPDDQIMFSVAAVDAGLVAVGSDGPEGDADAAVWVSSDGTDWTRVGHDESTFGGPSRQRMLAVAAADTGLVAVGWDDSSGDFDAAVWVSADGTDWTRVSHDEAIFGGAGDQQMVAVAATSSGVVAVGSDGSEGDFDATVWVSADGTNWTRVIDGNGVFGGVGDQLMFSVAVGGPGLIAVGSDGVDGDLDAVVWASADGTDWARVSHDEAIFGGAGDQQMVSVAANGPDLIAVGSDVVGRDVDAAVWLSVDAEDWIRVGGSEGVFRHPGDQIMRSVATTELGLVVVGFDVALENVDAAVWVSAEGLGWARVRAGEVLFDGPDTAGILSVAATGSGAVAVGREGSDDSDAVVWLAR